MRALLFAGLLLLPSTACAASWGYGTPNFDGWPPQRFTGDRSATVHFLTHKAVVADCSDGHPNDDIEACSNGFVITMPNPCMFSESDNYARLLCHEIGHLNGWAGNHPR